MSEHDTDNERVAAARVAAEMAEVVERHGITSFYARLNVAFLLVMNLVGLRGFSELQKALRDEPVGLGNAPRDEFLPRSGPARTDGGD